ncbi:purine nucleoside permease [Nocardia otitidiscaviarum]|uniref:purine-nucleoside phosphorylase n=1 Tax=Nocardia otitidiscaviarum TaxID=1823 RepID=UPI0004A6D0BA|nr:purine nucleoside permease [Nocardia otitidiscaviarum]MBF6133953.1 purine nucleoside permease [Nocardia otitidiscaviarum]MBF6484386.1 purine nucleoside permease [Nocardia otitidiscaviarum]
MTHRCRKFAIALGVAALALTGCSGTEDGPDRLEVGVLVITMFDPESEVWLRREQLPTTVEVPGAYKPVTCNGDGLCVAETGQGKSNAATTMTAILSSPKFDFSHAWFLTAGIAGTPPDQGTLGSASWARWVVDFDLGNHLDPAEAPEVPFGFRPVEDYNTAAYRLDDALVDTAYELTREATLADSPEAAAERAQYPGQAGRTPDVRICDTMTGDDYFSGKVPSETARHIMGVRSKGEGVYCTTQMEDNATATALNGFGYLDRYLSLRTVSNFDQPFPGQSVVAHLDHSGPGFALALENQYTVGRRVVDHLLQNPYRN